MGRANFFHVIAGLFHVRFAAPASRICLDIDGFHAKLWPVIHTFTDR
jgi:hypothetical protein